MMDIVRLMIPYDFVRDRVRLGWRGMHFGLRNELLDPKAPREWAIDEVATAEEPSSALLELASDRKSEPITITLVEKLAADEPECTEDEVREKWLYLALAWVYEHQDRIPDPLQRVEEIYADFGYPERIARFVRYMPIEGPDLGSREANEHRLFERWRCYLDEVARDSKNATT